jgi:glutamate transport system permease protein
MTTNVLYDRLGPRARRRALIVNIAAGAALLGLAALAAVRLADGGQFAADRWSPLFNPLDPVFGAVWALLAEGIGHTLLGAALAIAFSLVIGTVLAVSRITANGLWRTVIVGFVELFRGAPVVLMIYFSARVLPGYGVDLAPIWYVVIGLTAYNSVVFSEIIRSGINSLPRGQSEAAHAIGLTRGQVLRKVLLPQAFRVMLPAIISQTVVALKDTSLGFVIQWQETVRTANILIQTLHNPIQMFLLVGGLFVVINHLLSMLAQRVERRVSRARPASRAAGSRRRAVPTG